MSDNNEEKKPLSMMMFKSQKITASHQDASEKLKEIVARQRMLNRRTENDNSNDGMDF